ncbi:MAG: hypothetical protein F7B17_02325 [Desulfurococcales archaeon]|nr:hypothetical protein [Desulfurococcales archaeon]
MAADDLRINGHVLCPRCRIPMYYGSEKVRDSNGTRITRYYQCPACKSKLVDERIEVKVEGEGLTLLFRLDGKTVITVKAVKRK